MRSLETLLLGPSYLTSTPAKGSSIIPHLAKDVVFALDQLAALNRADPNGSAAPERGGDAVF